MGLLSKFFSNTRKPEGFFGKLMVNGMNGGGHAQMAEWALQSVKTNDDYHILDIGCGGGGNIARMLQLVPNGSVTGIDYSPVSVRKSRKVNSGAIAKGRCKVLEGDAANLPFKDISFDIVTAFETVYFWPDIEHCFAEVRRVLKPDGQFVIVNESDGSGPMDSKWESLIEGMHTYKPDELKCHLGNAGFADVNIILDEKRHWLVAIAKTK